MFTAIGTGGGGGGGGPVTVIVALADFVVSVSEVAVIVTAPPAGMAAGAVYTVFAPDAVVVGLNEPHAPEPQVAIQATPAPTGSLVTDAVRFSVPPISNKLVTALEKEMATGVGRMVNRRSLVCEGSLVTEAVIVIDVPIGTAEGAVKVVAAPSAVCVGERVPHAPLVMLPVTGLPPHVTVQSTPASALSPDGIMLSFSGEPMESALPGAVTPAAVTVEMGPALTPEVAPPPQPDVIPAMESRLTMPHKRRWEDMERRVETEEADFSDKFRVSVESMSAGVLLLSAQSGSTLRLSERFTRPRGEVS
jgi:hypothetical protein